VGGGGGGGAPPPERRGRPGRQSPRGGKVNILNEKKIDFLRSTIFKLLRKIKGTSINNFDFL
jgi:hypothetical protein